MSFLFTDTLKSYTLLAGTTLAGPTDDTTIVNCGFYGSANHAISGNFSPSINKMNDFASGAEADLGAAIANFPATNASTDISSYNWTTPIIITPGSYYSSVNVNLAFPGSITFDGSATDTFYIYINAGLFTLLG